MKKKPLIDASVLLCSRHAQTSLKATVLTTRLSESGLKDARDDDEARRLDVRQRLQQHGVDHGEDRSRRADAEPENENCDAGERQISPQRSESEANVLSDRIHARSPRVGTVSEV